MKEKKKSRIDSLLVDLGLVPSREKSKALIMAGKVRVAGKVVDKAGTQVAVDAEITLTESLPFVGRGGIKLEGALKDFKVDVCDLTVMDVGSSTGGFTDCLLRRGAKKVYAIDVGKGLIDWSLRSDERVVLLEGRNVRYLEFEEVGEKVDMAVVDLSFISLTKVLLKITEFLLPGASIIALVKPQFEVGKGEVGKGGIVRDPEKHRQVMKEIKEFANSIGLTPLGECESPIKGKKGNTEFWLLLMVPEA